jgi:hypothetical protein
MQLGEVIEIIEVEPAPIELPQPEAEPLVAEPLVAEPGPVEAPVPE